MTVNRPACPSLRARDGHGATYDWTVVTTQTEILAEGRPRTLPPSLLVRLVRRAALLGRKNSPFEIVRELKDALDRPGKFGGTFLPT